MVGAERLSIVLLMVFGAQLLLTTTATPTLINGILFLASPLQRLGFSVDRLAVRLALILRIVTDVQALKPQIKTDLTSPIGWVTRMAQPLVQWFQMVQDQAEGAPLAGVVIEPQWTPDMSEWFYPVLLALVFVIL